MAESRRQSPNRTIRAVKRVSYRNQLGQWREGLVIKWSDGVRTQHLSAKSLPDDVRQALAEFERRCQAAVSSGNATSTITRASRHRRVRARRIKPGGSRWGTFWSRDQDRLKVSWPSLPFSIPFGFFGLVFCAFIIISHLVKQQEFGPWLPWLIVIASLSILLLVSAGLFRESFTITATNASCSRWPGFLRPRQAVARDKVVNAIVKLFVVHGKHVRRIGTIDVRVRRADGIQWWRVGGSLGWSEAQRLGQQLARYMEVRVEKSGE